MLRKRIQYYGKRLSIYLSGNASYEELNFLKDDIRKLIKKYNINRINLEIDRQSNITYDYFSEFDGYFNAYQKMEYLYWKLK